MKNKKLEANLSMAVSKIFSGLNMNALKYLLPPMDEPVDRCDTSLHLCRRCILGDRMVHAAGKVIRQRQMAAFPVRGIRTVRLYVSLSGGVE